MAYYVLDTETTGLSYGWHEITQISIIRCSDRMQFSKYVAAKHPERASEIALEITGRTRQEITTGHDSKEVVRLCNEFFDEDEKKPHQRCIIAHNAVFDKNMCYTLWKSLGQRFPAELWLCTKSYTKTFATKKLGMVKPKLTLEASLDHARIKARPGAHNAITDSQNTYLLWSKLKNEEQVDYLPSITSYSFDDFVIPER